MQDRSFWGGLHPRARYFLSILMGCYFLGVLGVVIFHTPPDLPTSYPCKIVSLDELEIDANQRGTHIAGFFGVERDGQWELRKGRLTGWRRTIRQARQLLDQEDEIGNVRCVEGEDNKLRVFFSPNGAVDPEAANDEVRLVLVTFALLLAGGVGFLLFAPRRIVRRTLLCGLLCGLLSTLGFCLFQVQKDLVATAGWQEVPCELSVLQSFSPDPSWNVDYSYRVDGVTYQGDILTGRDSEWMLWLSPKMNRMIAHEQGSCFVNPQNPTEACLQRYDQSLLVLALNISFWLVLMFFCRYQKWNMERRLAGQMSVFVVGSASLLWMLPGVFGEVWRKGVNLDSVMEHLGAVYGLTGLFLIVVMNTRVLSDWCRRTTIKRGIGVTTFSHKYCLLLEFLAQVRDNRPTQLRRVSTGRVSIAEALEAIGTGHKLASNASGKKLKVNPLIRLMFEQRGHGTEK